MARGRNNDGGPNAGWFKRGDPKLKIKSPRHRSAIAEGQRRAWETKRERMPIGSRRRDPQGYIRVKVLRGKGPWRFEHVIVMEGKIGRPLIKGEIVHHVDGDRENNVPDNLFLCRSHAHHMEVERQLKETFRAMLKLGKVTFSHALGVYSCH